MTTPAAALETAFREEWATVLAFLARRLGDLGAAEEATQAAFASAAEAWPRDGVPDRPGAWLTTTAWRRGLDALRRARSQAGPAALEHLPSAETPEAGAGRSRGEDDAPPPAALADDRLRLVFLCCHPALAPEARIALTLRMVAGLQTAQIARAFLTSEATMAQRLVRAKRKIREANIPLAVPAERELPERVAGVLGVLYLVFTEGHTATEGERLVAADLCAEAIRLVRLVVALRPGDPEAEGLLALLLLHDARSPGREDAAGRPVPLAEQDRSTWKRAQIREGCEILERALRRRRPATYQLQAAVAALHAQAPTAETTDWAQIAALYGELGRRAPSPVVEVNRAVAVGMADGPQAGLTVLEPLLAAGTLEGYAPLHAAHADLLERAGDAPGARAAWARASRLAGNVLHRAELARRAAGAAPADAPGPAAALAACPSRSTAPDQDRRGGSLPQSGASAPPR